MGGIAVLLVRMRQTQTMKVCVPKETPERSVSLGVTTFNFPPVNK